MKKKDNESSFKTKLIAGTGGAFIGATGRQITAVDELGGYSKRIENALNELQVHPKISYHIAGISKRIPAAGLGAIASLVTYETLQDKTEKETFLKKLRNAGIAGLVSAGLTSAIPGIRNTTTLPSEIAHKIGTERTHLLLRNRLAQAMLGAPAALLTYSAIKKDKDSTLNTLAASSGAAVAGSLAASYPAAKYEALVPKVEAKAQAIGRNLEGFSNLFKHKTSTGATLGTMTGRMYHGSLSKLPAAVLGTGLAYFGYGAIKDYLERKKK